MLYSQGRGKSEREHYPQNEDLKAARIKKLGILRCLEYPTKVVLDVLRFFPCTLALEFRFESALERKDIEYQAQKQKQLCQWKKQSPLK